MANTSLLLDLPVPVNPRLQDALTGLLLPTEGEIFVDGMDTNDDDLICGHYRKKIGMASS